MGKIDEIYEHARSCIAGDVFGVLSAVSACLEIVYLNSKVLKEIKEKLDTEDEPEKIGDKADE